MAARALVAMFLLGACRVEPIESTNPADSPQPSELENAGAPPATHEAPQDGDTPAADTSLAAAEIPAGDARPPAEVITFDEVDANEGPAEPIGGIAPRRKKIESFQLFGTNRRGGPG